MAIAGRILIMPKGNYDASVTYEMLDLVKHNGTSWLAKKTVVGIEPSEENAEYWHKLIDLDITANDVGALSQFAYLGGATDDGNAVSYTNIDTLPDGVYGYNGWAYEAISCSVQLPFINAMGIWIKKSRYNSTDTVARQDVVINVSTGAVYTMDAFDGKWHDCYLSKTGGTMTGDLKFEKGNPRVQMKNTNNDRFTILESGADGFSSIGNWKSDTDQCNLQVRKPADGLEEAVRLTVNGNSSFRMFGEHNIDLLKRLLGLN